MKLSIGSCIAAIAMIPLSIVVRGQASCTPAFTPGVSPICGVDPLPNDCAFFDDGSGPVLYVTGSITSAGDVPVSRIARWDGVSWSGVAGGLSGNYGSKFAVHDDGSGPALYVVGSFTAAGGVPASNVARWNGTSWSAVGPGIPVPGYTLAAGVLGGVPSLFAATIGAINGVFRWTGTTWTQIATADNWVTSLAIEDIGSGAKLWVGGRFSNIAGIAASKIASFDGTSWQALGSGVGTPGFFTGVAACRAFGGELFVGGDFPAAPGISENIARWNGASWMPAGTGLGGSSGEVYDLEVFDDGTGAALYASGGFVNAGNLGRWTGTGWTAVGGGIAGLSGQMAMATLDTPGPGGLLAVAGSVTLVGGVTTQVGGIPVRGVGSWNGSNWSAVGTGFNSPIVCAASANGDLFVGGDFTQAPGGVPAKRVGRWNGSVWSGFGAGPPGPVWALLPSTVGGQGLFAGVNNGPVTRWNGATWQSPGIGAPQWVSCLAEYAPPSGTVVVAAAGPVVAQWNGATWAMPFGSAGGPGASVRALADGPPGATNLLFVGGYFSSFGAVGQANLVCLNGTSVQPPPFAWNGSLEVRCMKLLDDGAGPALFIAGRTHDFGPTQPPGAPVLFRWDGMSLAAIGAFGFAGADITDLGIVAESSGPVLYAVGTFATIDGMTVQKVGRRIGGAWTGVPGNLGGSTPVVVQGVSEGGGFAAYLGGGFTSFGGLPSSCLARFGCPRPSLSVTQPAGAASPVFVTSSGLVASRETFNVFSVELCAGLPGGGPLLGLCASDPTTLLNQASLPVGAEPFHFIALQPSMTFGPYSAPPILVDGLCVDFDAMSGYRWSPVTRVAIQ